MCYKVFPDFDHVCVFVHGCMFLCIMCVAGYKQAYLSRQMDVAEVKKALTERILMHDRAEKEVSVTATTEGCGGSAHSDKNCNLIALNCGLTAPD